MGELVTSSCHTTCNVCAVDQDSRSPVSNETLEFNLGVVTPCGYFGSEHGVLNWITQVGGNISVGNGTISINYINMPVCNVPESNGCLAFQGAAINLVGENTIHAALVPPTCARDVAAVYVDARINHFILPSEGSRASTWGWSPFQWHPFVDTVKPVIEVLNLAKLKKTAVVYAVRPEEGASRGMQDMMDALESSSSSQLELVYLKEYNETGVNFSRSQVPGMFTDPYNSSTFDSFLFEMQDAGVEVAMFYSAGERVSIMNRIFELKIDFKAIYFDLEDGTLMDYLGEKADMVLTQLQWAANLQHDCDVFGSNAEFVSGFQGSYGRTPTQEEAMGATVGVLLTLAMQRFGSIDSEMLMLALQVLRAETLFGHIYFHLNKDIGRETLAIQYLSGVAEIVGVRGEATAQAVLPAVSWECRELSAGFLCSNENLTKWGACVQEFLSLVNISSNAKCIGLVDRAVSSEKFDSRLTLGLAILAGASLLLLGVAAALLLMFRKRSWIDASLVHTLRDGEGQPVVLGNGVFGSVHAATYRGAKVACICIMPEANLASKAPATTGPPSLLQNNPSSAPGENHSAPTPTPTQHIITKTRPPNSQQNDEISPISEPSPPQTPMAGLFAMSSWGVSYIIGQATLLQLKKEIRKLKKLRHPQIVYVAGAYRNEDNSCYLVTECMDCGSMRDMLDNNLSIDNPTKIRILANVTSGLQFLHNASPPVIHGDVTSRNILVDSNIVAKLTGFELHTKSSVSGTHGDAFWMAPELLDTPDVVHPSDPAIIPRLTKESDVYALGVTMWELFSTKRVPYNSLGCENTQVLDAIRLRDLRPEVPDEAPPAIRDLMVECWHKNPHRRPKVAEVATRLQDCLREYKGHAARQARRSTENINLLHQVLPPRVVEALLRGEKVKPEPFDPVTLFFSDIVGYTDISAELPPEKVMNMLDRLYTQFDAVCSRYRLFKVETIGDAYMCVSGLPERQSDHTVRVALFAMDVIQAANQTPVDLENEQLGNLNIRVGFHSGAVIGSVVGDLNPRFCLFGDTVNTASRMESNSEKNGINMSPQGHRNLLEQAPNALTQSRGLVQIKGKGNMECFFLVQSKENHRNLRKVFERVMRGNSNQFCLDSLSTLRFHSDDSNIELVCE